jgi:hypothetical protein
MRRKGSNEEDEPSEQKVPAEEIKGPLICLLNWFSRKK